MVCPACQAENRDDAKFCRACGTALALRCPACGAAHLPDQGFCDECGTPLSASAPRVAAAPAVGPTAPAPGTAELRMVSVLFVDLVGYTSLSESRDAEDVRELLGRYFDTARTIVDRYGGTIEKFIGDAVMAVWGVPIAREDDAERAVRAGLEMVNAVVAFGEEVGAPAIQARAGVVTGQVASLAEPGQGLVVGDRVNTASRVQSIARPGTVYVDEITRQVTSAAIAYEDAGTHLVKGKAEPLQVWRASRVIAGVAGSQRTEGLEAPLVGRDSEVRLVKELFHGGVDRKAARLVAVSGPAGVGKTRLRWEFEKYIDGLADTILWHSGRCLSYGEGVAYWALAEMVRQRLGIPEEARPHEAQEKLRAGLDRWVVDADEREFLAPRLGALLGVAEPGLGREELFAGWRLFFERLAEHEPVTLVFEDLHWADEGLLDFIEHLVDWSAQHPIFILTFARPELGDRREGWPAGRRGATLLSLEPLGDTAMGELLDGLVDGLPAEARDRIVARAEGIPLYAVETVRALADRGILAADDGGLVLVGELGELDVPASLSSLLSARLDGLDPEERELVKSMSVFGGSFPRAAAAALSDVPHERVDTVLANLVRKQVLAISADRLSPDRGQYGFAQTLLRTVAYEMLSKRERKPRHLAAAEHLRQAFPDDGEDVAEVIAHHYFDAYEAAGEDPDADDLRAQALAAMRRAGQRAATVGAPEAAERAYRTAMELAADERERAELTTAAGEMTLRAGNYDQALELFEAAAGAHAAAGRDLEAARLAHHIGASLRSAGRLEEAVERMRAALEVLERERADTELALLNAELGTALAFAGRNAEAAAPLERALSIAEALELHGVISHALVRKATMFMNVGRWEEALILMEGSVTAAERHGLRLELVRALGNVGDLRMKRDLPGAAEAIEKALAASRRVGDRTNEIINIGNLMLVHVLAGRWAEVRPLAVDVLGGPVESPRELLHARLVLLAALQGDLDAARASAVHLTHLENSGDVEARGISAATAATLALAEGRMEDALAGALSATRESIAAAEDASTEPVRQAWPDAVDAAVALGRIDALEELVELVDQAPGHVPPYLRAHLARGRGLLAAARGEHGDVEADLTAAIEGFDALGYALWVARGQTDLAAWLIDRERAQEAAGPLDDAIATLERLGAKPALARARELFAGAPERVRA